MRSAVILAVVALAGLAAAIQAQNPYALNKKIFLNPDYTSELDAAGKVNPALRAKFNTIKKYPTFIWLDSIAMLDKLPGYLAAAKAQDAMIQIVVYDLPNRDCAALASNGELLVQKDGLNLYKTKYVDKLAQILDQYPSVPVVMVIEPDSLPNMVTNKDKYDSCRIVNSVWPSAYHQGVAYAIKTLKGANRYMYIDAAHECWLGWQNNIQGFYDVINQVLQQAGDTSSVRGFSVNVANYQTLENAKGCGDYNPVYGLLNYVKQLNDKFKWGVFGQSGPSFIVDTGRNGAPDQRHVVGNWCNIKGAGIGARPQTSPNPSYSMIDAYTWIKPPGQSDGVSDPNAPRFDGKCGSEDSLTGAPQAGKWFQAQAEMLITNAQPAIEDSPSGQTSSSKKPIDDDSFRPGSASSVAVGAVTVAAVARLF
eukprot:m51a1_g4002 putative cellulase (422) ;mRNA; r:524207-525540